MGKICENGTCREQFRTMIGGQALIEGIMMRGPEKQSIVVRKQDGTLEEKVETLHPLKEKSAVFGWPLIRGVINFFDSMINGVKALTYSAEFFPEDDPNAEPDKLDRWLEAHFKEGTLEKLIVPVGVVLGVAFSVGLFILVPAILMELLSGVITSYVIRNILEGFLRIGIFLGYLALISKMPDMKRVFSYHGAEHKSIRCYEARLPLTVENVRKMTRFHPRCGTSFLFVVMVISILVFTVIRVTNPLLRVVCRLALLPVVVAISYEINRFVGRHDNAFTRFLTMPGLWFQNFTTQEPDDSMIETAIRALELVLPEQEGSDKW